MNSGGLDRNKISRYELKYIIPKKLVPLIEDYLEIHCEKDNHSVKAPDGYYTVNTLYLDSPSFLLLDHKQSDLSERFTLRIRSYADGTCPPYFFEVKKKYGMTIDKVRSCVQVNDLLEVFKRPDGDFDKRNLKYFIRKAEELHARPKIFTQYKRLAFFSVFDEYVRITFDRDLKFSKSKKFDVTPGNYELNNYDHDAFLKGMPTDSVILEIKTLTSVPKWVIEFIQYFALERMSFSKFESSLTESFGVHDQDFLELRPIN
jgi:SPX domain protein involved in polyphosphate accumulation